MKDYLIEYEIPPLRAIYTAECNADSEEEVRKSVWAQEPLWKIRKITVSDKDKN